MAKQVKVEEYEQFKKDQQTSINAIKVTEQYPNGDYNILYKLNSNPRIFMCMEVFVDEDNTMSYWIF